MGTEEIIIQTKDVKVRVMELKPGETGPLHHHTEVTDNMFGISGEIVVLTKNPDEKKVLTPGIHFKIKPGRTHQVVNNLENEKSKYLLVQGVGEYDFIEELV